MTHDVPGLHVITTNYASVANAELYLYLLDGNSSAALVDAGVASTPQAGAVGQVEAHLDGRRLGHLLITHAHQDHAGGGRGWVDAFGCRVAVPRGDLLWTEQPEEQWEWFWSRVGDVFDISASRELILEWAGGGVEADVVVRDGDEIEVGNDAVRVVQTGAHTPGHACYLSRRQRVLFTGDLVQGWGNRSSDGRDAFAPLYHSVARYRAGLRRLADLDFNWLAPAHRQVHDRESGLAFIHESLQFVDAVQEHVATHAEEDLDVVRLAGHIAEMVGCRQGLTVQTVTTARAHLEDAVERGDLVVSAPRRFATP